MRKYKLTDETIEVDGRTLHRIQALVDFSNVKTGELGGYVESEENLSQNGDAWVYGNAMVYDGAFIIDDGKVFSNARVFNNARVGGNSIIANSAKVFDYARVIGDAFVADAAVVCGYVAIAGYTRVMGNAFVSGDKIISGCHTLGIDADVRDYKHYISIENIGSRYDTTTFYRNKNNGVSVKCGCFNGTIDEFRKAVKERHEENKHARVYELACALAEEQIEDVVF